MMRPPVLIPFVLAAVLLAACAGKPARPLAPSSDTVLVSRGTDGDIADGIRALLHESAKRATEYLSRPNGWDRRDATRIATPEIAEPVVAALRVYGYGRLWDPVMADINRGAERSAALALPVLDAAIDRLVIDDVDALMRGGDDRATMLLCTAERDALVMEYATALKRGLAEAGYFTSVGILVQRYNEIPLLTDITAPDIEPELRPHGVDALCMHMAEQEARMRAHPEDRPEGPVKVLFQRPW